MALQVRTSRDYALTIHTYEAQFPTFRKRSAIQGYIQAARTALSSNAIYDHELRDVLETAQIT